MLVISLILHAYVPLSLSLFSFFMTVSTAPSPHGDTIAEQLAGTHVSSQLCDAFDVWRACSGNQDALLLQPNGNPFRLSVALCFSFLSPRKSCPYLFESVNDLQTKLSIVYLYSLC